MLDRPKAMEQRVGGISDRVSRSARRWANAEILLLRAEFGDLRRRCVYALFLALAALALLVSGFTILAQLAITIATPYLGGPGSAGVIVGALLLGLAPLLAKAANRMLAWRGENLLVRLFGARSSS